MVTYFWTILYIGLLQFESAFKSIHDYTKYAHVIQAYAHNETASASRDGALFLDPKKPNRLGLILSPYCRQVLGL